MFIVQSRSPDALGQCSIDCACANQKQQTTMASSMGGMFPGQQPSGPHGVGGPGGPAQPGLLPGTPGGRGQGSNTLVDDLEASFEVRREHRRVDAKLRS